MGGRAGGGASGGMGIGSRGRGGLQRSLESVESSIRGLPYENSYTLDENGNILTSYTGTSGRVVIGLPKDHIVTHNHPDVDRNGVRRSDGGGSLSKKDLMNAIQMDMKEARAVTKTYTYSFKRPKGGWPVEKGSFSNGLDWKNGGLKSTPGMKKIEKAYSQAVKIVTGRLDKYVASQPRTNRKAASSRAFSVKYHMINKEFARLTGLDYSATKVK